MAKKDTQKPAVYLMTDEEFYAMKLKEDKKSIMDSLIEATETPTKRKSFSVKSVDKPSNTVKKEKEEKTFDEIFDKMGTLSSISSIDGKKSDSDDPLEFLRTSSWQNILDEFDEISPIDDITYEDRMAYRKQKDRDKYDEMFYKEQSMLNDLLSGLQKRSKLLDKKIDSMTGKGTYGIAKNFSDLVEASNTVETTKLNVIKELVNIKKTASDLRMKDLKANPQEMDVDDRDTIADKFYKSIIAGKSNEFIQSSMSSYGNTVLQNNNISQPMDYRGDTSYDNDQGISSYIQNETRNVQIYVCQHDDGTNEFIAIDGDGFVIEDYDIPSDAVLQGLSIKPGSNFAFDVYSRKYPLITDEDLNGLGYEENDEVDEYDTSSDDKYTFADEAENEDIDDNYYDNE